MVKVELIRSIDRVLGRFCCFVLSIFMNRKKMLVSNPKEILIIQLWGIGETILTLPAVNAVCKQFPNANISILTTDRVKEVYAASGLKLRLHSIKVSPFALLKFILAYRKSFDLVIDMEEYLNSSAIVSFFVGRYCIGFAGGARSLLYHMTVKYNDKQHVVHTFLDLVRLAGVKNRPSELMNLRSNAKDVKNINYFLKKLPPHKILVGVVPGAAESAKSRMWPTENYIALLKMILNDSVGLVLIGSPTEKELTNSIAKEIKSRKLIDIAGKISVPELFCLISKLDVLITNDTGPLHIASAQKTKTIALFGPNTPVRFGPYNKNSIAIYQKKSCSYFPCLNVHLGQVPDCLYSKQSPEYQKCMKAISVNEVYAAYKKLC